jgi:hypothetical protein
MSRGNGGCGLGGAPDNPAAQRAVVNILATIEARRVNPDVRLRELVDNNPRTGPYWRQWYCEPPGYGMMWRSVHDEWTEPAGDELPVRSVYEIRLADE